MLPNNFRAVRWNRRVSVVLTLLLLVLAIGLTSGHAFRPIRKKLPPHAGNIRDGYTDKLSYFPGERVSLYLNASDSCNVTLRLLDVNGAPVDSLITRVYAQKPGNALPYENGFGYARTCVLRLDRHLKSGLYRFENTDIRFIVKEKKHRADIVVVYPTNTEQAYNNYGGKSLYDFNSGNKRASVVSFRRPMVYQLTDKINNKKYVDGFLCWLSKSSYHYSLISDMDLDEYATLDHAKVLVIIGHSEYWTRQARLNVDQFIDEGKNVAVFSGNTMWWQVRYSEDRGQLICTKDIHKDSTGEDKLKTINWTDGSLSYPVMPSIGVDFLHGGYGYKTDNGWDGYKITAPASPLLAGTGIKAGDILSCPTIEFDGTALLPADSSGVPVIDRRVLNFYKLELIGYDLGSCQVKGCRPVETFIAFQKNDHAGKVVNTASTNWCSPATFNGKDSTSIRTITRNTLDLLLHDKNIFSQPVN